MSGPSNQIIVNYHPIKINPFYKGVFDFAIHHILINEVLKITDCNLKTVVAMINYRSFYDLPDQHVHQKCKRVKP